MFGLTDNRYRTRPKSCRQATFQPQLEALENRVVMSAATAVGTVASAGLSIANSSSPPSLQPTTTGLALINGLADPSVRSAALADYQRDGYLSRNDMIDIFNKGSTGYTSLTSTGFASLQTLVNNGPTVGMPLYVQDLASKTLTNGHAELQAEIKSMQEDGVSQVVLNRFLARENVTLAQNIHEEVDNFFLGQLHPDASFVLDGSIETPTYEQVNLPLFNGLPTYQDVVQGSTVGDCWLVASLAEVAARNPNDIVNMFIDNGDGTYTVRFFNGTTADYVTVDKLLPGGGTLCDQPQGDLWVALAEKAYAQENGARWIGSSHQGVDSYQALDGGQPQWALAAITGLSASTFTNMNVANIGAAWTQGQFVVLCTPSNPSSPLVVSDHCYAMVNYTSGWVTLFNPWGVNGVTDAVTHKFYPGMIEADAGGVAANFTWWAEAGAAAGWTAPQAFVTAGFAPADARLALVSRYQTEPNGPPNLSNSFASAFGSEHSMLQHGWDSHSEPQLGNGMPISLEKGQSGPAALDDFFGQIDTVYGNRLPFGI